LLPEGIYHGTGFMGQAEIRVGIAHLLDHPAGDFLRLDRGLRGDLPAHQDQALHDERLTGHPALWVLGQYGVEHRVRDPIRNLIRMPLGNGFRSDKFGAH